MKKIRFRRRIYNFIITDHAKVRMKMRGINEFALREVIEMGVFKLKARKNKFWVFKEIENRKDNLICASISVEPPNLIVITTLINWRPK
ncbi:MAG: hypothetical protein OXH36_03570 [Bdellovibrionales bacterium]|nr:hypothetical protein [Bdellovibrionales bacterium]